MAPPLQANYGPKYNPWMVFKDTSSIENDKTKDRLGLSSGYLYLGDTVISTSEISLGGTLNVKNKTISSGVTQFQDVYFDLQISKYLYAKITLATKTIELEYSSQPPNGNGKITLLDSTYQRIPLAYIDAQKNVIDLRAFMAGGSGGTTTTKPFTVTTKANNRFTIWPGTINEKLVDGITSEYSYYATGVWFLKIVCTTNGKQITSAALGMNQTATAAMKTLQNAPDTSFEILIGVFSAGTWYQVNTGNITATPTQVFVSEKTSPLPGQSLVDRWWTWAITFSS